MVPVARACVSSPDIESLSVYLRSLMFRPSRHPDAANMPSADFCTTIPTPHDVSSTMAAAQISPGMTHPPSRLGPSDIRRVLPCKYRALTILAVSPEHDASYPLPVRRASALPSASFRSPVSRGTLAVRLTLPLVGRVVDFHHQVSAPCRAHQKKTPPKRAALSYRPADRLTY